MEGKGREGKGKERMKDIRFSVLDYLSADLSLDTLILQLKVEQEILDSNSMSSSLDYQAL